MAKTQYLDNTGLQELIAQIKAADTATLNAAKAYAGTLPADATQTTVLDYVLAQIDNSEFSGKAEDVELDEIEGLTATDVQAAVEELLGVLTVLKGADTVDGSIAKSIKTAIGNLKNEDEAVDHQFVTAVAEADGVITVSREALVADDIPELTLAKISDAGTAAAADVATVAIGTTDENEAALPTVGQIKTYITSEVADIEGALHFVGIVEDLPTVADSEDGDVCVIGTKEYIFANGAWKELGDEGLWVPNTRTVAGAALSADITAEALKSALDVDDLETVVGDNTSGLVKDVADLQDLVGEGVEAIPVATITALFNPVTP